MERFIQQSQLDHTEDVEELNIDSWRGQAITQADKQLLEKFENLGYLSMIGCGLRTLENFPELPNLLKLDLSDNRISGGLQPLTSLEELMQLSLAGNAIADISELNCLQSLENLVSFDLTNCPVTNSEQYRDKVFELLPNLQILDGKDQNGETASLKSEDEEDYDDQIDEQELKKFIEEDFDDLEEGDEDEDEEGSYDDDEDDFDDEPPNNKRPRDDEADDEPRKRRKVGQQLS